MKIKEIYKKMDELEDYLSSSKGIIDFVKITFFSDGSGNIQTDFQGMIYFSFQDVEDLKVFLKKDVTDLFR